MVKIFLFGANGRMGRAVRTAALAGGDYMIVGGFDLGGGDETCPVFNEVDNVNVDFDVIVDFSAPAALDCLVALAKKSGKPVVIAATGHSEKQQEQILELSKTVPVLKSGNFSIGINLMLELVKTASSATKADGFDIEIVEAHHRYKADAPSGTAKMIADAAMSVREDVALVYGREGANAKREKNEIGIHAVRGGGIIGEHELILVSDKERLSISHSAFSRDIFADGALKAARFLLAKKPGMYTMSDCIKNS